MMFANDGVEMLEKLDAADVIVTDIIMPHMDGAAAARIVRLYMNKNIPIIGITGMSDVTPEDSSFDVVLSKPVKLAELITTIELQYNLKPGAKNEDKDR